jgi:hypothetical protein
MRRSHTRQDARRCLSTRGLSPILICSMMAHANSLRRQNDSHHRVPETGVQVRWANWADGQDQNTQEGEHKAWSGPNHNEEPVVQASGYFSEVFDFGSMVCSDLRDPSGERVTLN